MARILVIEPDVQISKFIAGILTDFGHDVHQCNNADDGSDCLAGSNFDVLVTDLILTDAEAAAALTHVGPRVTLTGEPHDAALANRSLPLQDRPFRFAELAQLAAEVARLVENARQLLRK